MKTYFFVNIDGAEFVSKIKPERNIEFKIWEAYDYVGSYQYKQCYDASIELTKGSIKRLLDKDLTWNDEPLEVEV